MWKTQHSKACLKAKFWQASRMQSKRNIFFLLCAFQRRDIVQHTQKKIGGGCLCEIEMMLIWSLKKYGLRPLSAPQHPRKLFLLANWFPSFLICLQPKFGSLLVNDWSTGRKFIMLLLFTVPKTASLCLRDVLLGLGLEATVCLLVHNKKSQVPSTPYIKALSYHFDSPQISWELWFVPSMLNKLQVSYAC